MNTTSFRIISAEFAVSSPKLANLPPAPLPEVAFVGRSNVGKSSLINALCNRKALARTSKTPGRTQMYNIFRLEYAEQKEEEELRHEAHLVDLPGYGYARIDKQTRSRWKQMLEQYLQQREQLAVVCLLIDARRDPGEEEQWITELGADGGLIVVLTKCDKLSRNEVNNRRTKIAKALNLSRESLIPTASASGKRQGLEQLTERICANLTAS